MIRRGRHVCELHESFGHTLFALFSVNFLQSIFKKLLEPFFAQTQLYYQVVAWVRMQLLEVVSAVRPICHKMFLTET